MNCYSKLFSPCLGHMIKRKISSTKYVKFYGQHFKNDILNFGELNWYILYGIFQYNLFLIVATPALHLKSFFLRSRNQINIWPKINIVPKHQGNCRRQLTSRIFKCSSNRRLKSHHPIGYNFWDTSLCHNLFKQT